MITVIDARESLRADITEIEMKTTILAIGGMMLLAAGSNANAALVINISGAAGGFTNNTVSCPAAAPCAFSHTGTFVTPSPYKLISITISSILAGGNPATNIDFTSVSLNGVNLVIAATGVAEFRSLQNLRITPGGTNTLAIAGITGGDASYAGAMSFGAVPEPSTWLMMIFGIGFLGAGLRRKRQADNTAALTA